MLNWTMSNTKVLNKWLSCTNVNDLTSTPPPTTIIILVVKRLMFVFYYYCKEKAVTQRDQCFGYCRENLSKDLYLISQMDGDQFVPIWTLACMENIKALTTDMDLILDVLRGTSASVCLCFT